MNRYYLILKGMNKDFAISEFSTLWNLYLEEKIKLEQVQNVLYTFKSKHTISSEETFLSRLTFTNYLGLELFRGNSFDEYKSILSKLDFSFLEGKTFGIEQKTFGQGEIIPSKELAHPIWDSLESPKVNLKHPQTWFVNFQLPNSKDFIFTKGIYKNDKEYLERMPKLRPVAMPYTLKSDMARAACNLLNLKEESIVLDPFCGIGGILLEAYDLGFEVMGNDISFNDLELLRKNFKHYYPKAQYSLTCKDSSHPIFAPNSIDGIVSDIPYGRSSRKLGIDLYKNFLENARNYLKPGSRMVIIYANFVEFKELALQYFKEVQEIDQYINKSMTRHILVLEKK